MDNKELIQLILNTQNDLHSRVKAIHDIDISGEKSKIIVELKNILSRKKNTEQGTMDWDPAAEERVVDIHVIGKLNQLNDDSENQKIVEIVSNAVPDIREFGDERKEDAKVIQSIHQKEVYAMIVNLTQSRKQNVAENAVVVLNHSKLPNAPVGGDVKGIFPGTTFTFKYSHLKDEMDSYVQASEGKIQLSEGVKKYIGDNNTQLANDGELITIQSTLSDAVEKNFNSTFNYYIENNKLIICTYQEAAKRWLDWWSKNENTIK
ncbi:hypothetical protein [Chryseobacterium sp. JM1]|uniref:hypothetical protein n=1 Tax=Chryseobacterium sp. JM1 TaxID=1233950 RepID=UPI0004E6C37E|nr:hypothetical protein [Chryseobacterium sp. JM1]KFF19212.1 hypothetical protein IW22_16205 [Chryseobacterium sp. JM1]